MTKHLVTFSGSRYHDTTQRIVEDAPKFGVDNVVVLDDNWLRNCRPGYWSRMEWFRQQRVKGEGKARGIDFFCFKPFVVLDFFRRMPAGDVMLYVDADTFPIADLTPLYDRCVADGGVMLFGARGCVQKVWTKRDAFILMGCDEPKYHDQWQAVARFMLFQKGGAFPADEFLGQWLGFTANPMVNTFDPSVLAPDYPEFREARCEQAVLGNLATRYGIKLHREACEFGCWTAPEDDPSVGEQYRYGVPYQMFSQTGAHSYRPGFSGDEGEGSAFRTVNE
jgi:hypothetical protein